MRKSKRGIALIIALTMSAILVMMVGALLLSTRGQKGLTLRYHDSVAALYVAEAGVAAAMAELTAQPAWGTTPVTYTGTMPNGQGTYTIVFDDDGNVEPHESVNNLANSGIVDGPRGLLSVPPNTADVVVIAVVDGFERRLEVLLRRGVGGSANKPLVASGKILLKGDVSVDGIKSLTDPTQVDAGIHSNSTMDAADQVVWDSQSGDTATITGEVTASSNNAGAIDMTSGGGTYTSGGEALGESYQPYPSVDIAATVASNSSHTALVPNSFGTTVVSSGDYTFSGGVINGDLVLDGANIYVTGDVTINGSVTGQGSLYVDGHTTLSGDAGVEANDAKNVALFSAGNVTLKGFSGTKFLEDLAAADPASFGVHYDQARTALAAIHTMIETQTYADWGPGGANNNTIEEWRRALGQEDGNLPAGFVHDNLGVMSDYLDANYPSDPTAQFVSAKLRQLKKFHDGESSPNPPGTTDAMIIQDYLDGTGLYSGAFAVLIDYSGYASVYDQMASEILQTDYDRLGTSYFQGLIYTNGYVYAANDVRVIGGVYAEKKPGSPVGPWMIDGMTVDAGDVFLTNGSSIIFNEEFMQNQNASGTGPVTVQTWLGR